MPAARRDENTRSLPADRVSPGQRARVAAADAELADLSARLRRLLRAQQPALFDRRGRLRKRALRQFLLERAGGKTRLTKDEVVALALAPLPSADAVA
jgi:hypothetical protein